MREFITKKTKSDLTKLGLYQVGGGSFGILLVIWSLYKTLDLQVATILFYLVFIAFFLFSIFCGFLCTEAKPAALKLSLINQFLQIGGFAMFGFAYSYVAGFYFTIGLDITESFQFNFGAGISKLNLIFNSESQKFEVDFNIIAAVIVIWISNLMKRVKSEMEMQKIAALGEN